MYAIVIFDTRLIKNQLADNTRIMVMSYTYEVIHCFWWGYIELAAIFAKLSVEKYIINLVSNFIDNFLEKYFSNILLHTYIVLP